MVKKGGVGGGEKKRRSVGTFNHNYYGEREGGEKKQACKRVTRLNS